MKKHFLLFTLLCVITAGCGETDPAEKSSPPTDGAKVESIQDGDTPQEDEKQGEELVENSEAEAMYNAVEKDINEAFERFLEKSSEAEGEVAKQAIFEELCPKPEEYTDRFFAVYESHPQTESGQMALEWIAERDANSDLGRKAMGILVSEHSNRESLPLIVPNLMYGDPVEQTETMLRSLIDDGEAPPSLKGAAIMTLAGFLSKLDEHKRSLKSNKGSYAPEIADYIEKSTVSMDEVSSLYNQLIEDFADLKLSEGVKKTFGEMAADSLYVMENLSVGCAALEIEGEDLDGTAFKLSDYRGKVVVLDFWGDW